MRALLFITLLFNDHDFQWTSGDLWITHRWNLEAIHKSNGIIVHNNASIQ